MHVRLFHDTLAGERLQTLWEIVNDQLEGVEREDAEYVCEQWWAEILVETSEMI